MPDISMNLTKPRLALIAAAAAGAGWLWWSVLAPDAAPTPWLNHVATMGAAPQSAAPFPVSAPVPESPASANSLGMTARAASEVGSEGYGPHIERAHHAGDAASAWQAVQWLLACATNNAQEDALRAARDGGVQASVITPLIEASQAEARRCQTVTDEHRRWLTELSERAMQAHVAGAAAVFANAEGWDARTATEQADALSAIRRDADGGDTATLLTSITSGGTWGLLPEERVAYLIAYIGLFDPPSGAVPAAKLLVAQSDLKDLTLSSAQWAAAKEAGTRIVATTRAKRGPS